MLTQQNFRRDFSLIVFASVSWGTVGIANRFLFASSTTNSLSLSFLRLAFADPFFVLASWFSLRERLFRSKRRDLGMMMLMGCLIGMSQA